MHAANINYSEVGKFAKIAEQWWDLEGDFKPLHLLNPTRMEYIQSRLPIKGKKVLDVGCGGGILAEALARENADVSGLDVSEESINVAKLHLMESQLAVEYVCTTVENYARQNPNCFDVVTCMEVLEHVPDPVSLIDACSQALIPGGSFVLSTLNRTFKSFTLGIVGAEYVLKLLPRGTHQHKNFIKPSELYRWCRSCGLEMLDITGLHYNPITQMFKLSPGVDINYLAHCRKK